MCFVTGQDEMDASYPEGAFLKIEYLKKKKSREKTSSI